jgi:hypothetical protein
MFIKKRGSQCDHNKRLPLYLQMQVQKRIYIFNDNNKHYI